MIFFKRKKERVPDVGKEEEFENNEADEISKGDGSSETQDVPVMQNRQGQNLQSTQSMQSSVSMDLPKLTARLDLVSSMLKEYSERFTSMSQQLGEVRAMAIQNEKSQSKLMESAEVAVDIVRSVKPEKLRIDYQKLDVKMQALNEKIEANKQFTESVMLELKDLRRKAGIFVGTEALLKLNEEVKSDLIEVQKLTSKARVSAEKSEQIFIEVQKEFTKNEKLAEVVNNLNSSYGGVKEELEKLKVDEGSVLKQSDFSEFKTVVDKRFGEINIAIEEAIKIKSQNERLAKLVETLLAVAQRNKEDIANIALSIGDSHIKKVGEYEEWLNSILRLIDSLAGQIAQIKNELGMDTGKLKVTTGDVIEGNKLNMENVKVPSDMSKSLVARPSMESFVDQQKIQEELKSLNKELLRLKKS